MAGIRILLLLFLPLLFLDGAHLEKSRAQPGKPWVSPVRGDDDIFSRQRDRVDSNKNDKLYPNSRTRTKAAQPGRLWDPSSAEDDRPTKSKKRDDPERNIRLVYKARPKQSGKTRPNQESPKDKDNSKNKDNDNKDYKNNNSSNSNNNNNSNNNVLGYICPQPNGNYKYSNRCDEYIQCKNYVPTAYLCPVGLQFNPYRQWTEYPCDHPSKVRCNDSPSTNILPAYSFALWPVGPPAPIRQNENSYSCPQPQGYFKNRDECNSYIACKNNVPRTFSCPPGLHFNRAVQWTDYPCDHPSVAQCEKKPDTSRDRVRESPQVCKQPHGYFKNGDECGSYIECKNYIPRLYSCPVGLNFNPNAEWTDYPCDDPSKVPCNRNTSQKARTEVSTERTESAKSRILTTPRPQTQQNYNYMCPQPHGYFRETGQQCDQYVECKNYVARSYSCPSEQYFNPNAAWTEYPCEPQSTVQC